MPACSLSLRSERRALRRWSRMNSPRSCRRRVERLRTSSRGPGDLPRCDLLLERVDDAVHLAPELGELALEVAQHLERRRRARRAGSPGGSPVSCRRRVARDRRASAARAREHPAAEHACRVIVERPDSALKIRGRSATRSPTVPPRSRRSRSASRISMRACANRRKYESAFSTSLHSVFMSRRSSSARPSRAPTKLGSVSRTIRSIRRSG